VWQQKGPDKSGRGTFYTPLLPELRPYNGATVMAVPCRSVSRGQVYLPVSPSQFALRLRHFNHDW
jgi:hypothetical protein